MFTKHNCVNLIRTLADNSVDAIITDPPYHTTNLPFDARDKIDWNYLFPELHRICKPDGAIVIFSQQPFTTDLINANRKYYRYEVIWEKSLALGFLNAKKRPLRAHENIIVFSEKGYCKYNPQKTKAKTNYGTKTRKGVCRHYQERRGSTWKDDGTRYPRSVLKYKNVLRSWGDKDAIHPTQKPLDLIKCLIQTYTDPGDTVFDPFSGSGTTSVAAINTGREYICCERDPKYFYQAKKRIETAKNSTNANGAESLIRLERSSSTAKCGG